MMVSNYILKINGINHYIYAQILIKIYWKMPQLAYPSVDTHGKHRPANATVMVVNGLGPNRHQTICNRHADSTVAAVSQDAHCTTIISPYEQNGVTTERSQLTDGYFVIGWLLLHLMLIKTQQECIHTYEIRLRHQLTYLLNYSYDIKIIFVEMMLKEENISLHWHHISVKTHKRLVLREVLKSWPQVVRTETW